ncbi:hypothetical protein GWI33_007451 [Rhynchophorus ferrugineus]|uniref:Uncharacterized protein n=1 Tax=Rhynchophorus ferrugineus TaxID=354439 RepID=A0A834MI93_RHYFE|nr:hypothetical protein GWI33_007451 [Rhynchophorus ferrugineus]
MKQWEDIYQWVLLNGIFTVRTAIIQRFNKGQLLVLLTQKYLRGKIYLPEEKILYRCLMLHFAINFDTNLENSRLKSRESSSKL